MDHRSTLLLLPLPLLLPSPVLPPFCRRSWSLS
jgi:hypothetical protein